MAIHRSLRLGAARRNTLAACLAAALAASGAGASGPARLGVDGSQAHTSSDEALFGPLHTTRNQSTTKKRPRGLGHTPAFDAPNQPTTITVDNCNDAGQGSLREAFANAVGSEVIAFSENLNCSLITLASGEISTTANVSLQGPGRDALTIDGADAGRVFYSTNALGLAIYDLTIANGGDDEGRGGCIFTTGDLFLIRTEVSGCRSGDGTAGAYGGGVFASRDLVMRESTVSGNSVSAADLAEGGGVYAYGDADVEGSTISDNTVTSVSGSALGGGLFANGNAIIVTSQVTENAADNIDGKAAGGGVFSLGTSMASSSAISGNTVYSQNSIASGGGIRSSTTTLMGSTLDANMVVTDCCLAAGGGVLAVGSITAIDSTVSNNQALSAGGVIGGGLVTYLPGDAGAVVLAGSTISGNSANGGSGTGGGVALALGSPFSIDNSTIAFNQASTTGGGIAGGDGSTASQLYSTLVANNQATNGADMAPIPGYGAFEVLGADNLVMASANITLPVDTLTDSPLLLPLANNGGPTMTHALANTSPAIDQGNNGNGYPFDQRGCPFEREVGLAADIGAFEVQDRLFVDGFDPVPLCFNPVPLFP